MILRIWSLVLLPLQYPACTSGSSQFMYCWSMTWRILNIILQDRVQVYSSLNILSHCPSFQLKWTLTFSSPVATGEFSKICWYIRCSTLTAPSFRILISSCEISSPPLALFVVSFDKAHLTSHSRMSGSRWVPTPSLPWSLRLFSIVVCILSLLNLFCFYYLFTFLSFIVFYCVHFCMKCSLKSPIFLNIM